LELSRHLLRNVTAALRNQARICQGKDGTIEFWLHKQRLRLVKNERRIQLDHATHQEKPRRWMLRMRMQWNWKPGVLNRQKAQPK
jgi:hypothetical protein